MNESGCPQDNFDQFYGSVFPQVYKFLFRMTRDSMVAEELCQETFIKYLERNGSFPRVEEARFWVFRVAKNLALNHMKRVGREQNAYNRNLHEPVIPPESGEDVYLKKESIRQVLTALNQLPKNLREVLVLKEYGNLNYREIASILRISEANVKVRAYRARERLARYFNELEGTDVP
ncbi:MAG: RNA polymerase sigma factor [Spirochaetales bacterium]